MGIRSQCQHGPVFNKGLHHPEPSYAALEAESGLPDAGPEMRKILYAQYAYRSLREMPLLTLPSKQYGKPAASRHSPDLIYVVA
jgi:hypothetical protein